MALPRGLENNIVRAAKVYLQKFSPGLAFSQKWHACGTAGNRDNRQNKACWHH